MASVGWWANDAPLFLGTGSCFGSRWSPTEDIQLPTDHRTRHLYCVGSSGSGKSRFIRHLVCQDIDCNRGFTLIDPHGDLYREVLGYIADKALPGKATAEAAAELGDKLVLLEPGNQQHGVPGINLLAVNPGQAPYTVVDSIIEVLKEIWEDAWGARMEDIIRHSLLLLQELGLTPLEMLPLLSNDDVRARLVARSRNADLRLYFEHHLGGIRRNELKQWVESTRNKFSAFLSSPYIRPVLGQSRSTLNFADILNNGGWLLVNLNRDHLKESRRLLGALLVSLIHNAAISRDRLPPAGRVLHTLWVDEFTEFYTPCFLHILEGARKLGLALAIFHQQLTQPPLDRRPAVVDALVSNAHTRVVFGVSRLDAQRLAGEIFFPTGSEIKFQESFLGIPLEEPRLWGMGEERERYQAELMQQGRAEAFISFKGLGAGRPEPFAATIPHVPDLMPNQHKIDLVRRHVAARYFRPLSTVHTEIRERWDAIQAGGLATQVGYL